MIHFQRLNMDNSFVLNIDGWKVLVDPWLEGTEVDFFGWFNTQWHRTPPMKYEDVPEFDTVLITQKYPDHFHEETLKKLCPTHIIAPKSLINKLNKLLPSSKIDSLDSNENTIQKNNCKVTFLATSRKIDPIYDAFILDNGKESVFIATHGYQLKPGDSELLKRTSPCQLLISPFNYYKLPFFLGGVVSPGLKGLEHLCENLNPVTIIATHDEDKHAKGLVSAFAKIDRPSSSEELMSYSWLKDRYLEVNDYHQIQIS